MAVQNSADLTNKPFVVHGNPATENRYSLAQDGARATALTTLTLLSFDSSTRTWVPFSDETATDGTQIPTGISFDSATAAQMVAGAVANFEVYSASEFRFDENQLVIESSKTLNTVVTQPANVNKNVRQHLADIGMIAVDVDPIDAVQS